MKVSFQDLKEHWEYIYNERLGIMAEGEPPNEAQIAIARQEANESAERVKAYLEKKK